MTEEIKKPQTIRPPALHALTIPPVPPRPRMKSISDRTTPTLTPESLRRESVGVRAFSDDRPTPRSTVIPRLPLPPMRAPMGTLVFHGAPPVPPPTPDPPLPRAEIPPPPQSSRVDVLPSDLMDPDYGVLDFNDPAPMARTTRPPPREEENAARKRRVKPWTLAVAAAVVASVGWHAAIDGWAKDHFGVAKKPLVASAIPAPKVVVSSPPPNRDPCAVTGEPKRLARRALVSGGVEFGALDHRIAFGVVTAHKEGSALELDASTLAVTSRANVVASEPLKRVVPALFTGEAIDADADRSAMRTVIDGDGDAVIGASGGFVVWGPRDGSSVTRLWRLWGRGDVEAARVTALGASGDRAVVFRRGGALWIGAFRDDAAPAPLVKLAVGARVGAPTLASNGDEAIVAWAQRNDAGSAWGVRWARWTPGTTDAMVHSLVLPPGGPGERALAPSVATLGGGKFLLAWTEAARATNVVRAQVIGAHDAPEGPAISISPRERVSGQQQIAIDEDGRGAIAYFARAGGAFELVPATPIACKAD